MHARTTVTGDWLSTDCEYQRAPHFAHGCACSVSQLVSAAHPSTIISVITFICAEAPYFWLYTGHSVCELCTVLRLHL